METRALLGAGDPLAVSYGTGVWLILGAAIVTSLWFPLPRDSKLAAVIGGWRFMTMLGVFLAWLFVVPAIFGAGGKGNTDTCPYFIEPGSTGAWVDAFGLGLVWWLGVGVLKAGAVSFARHERHGLAMVILAALAIAVGFVALILLALGQICP
jgi:hypothetical protein